MIHLRLLLLLLLLQRGYGQGGRIPVISGDATTAAAAAAPGLAYARHLNGCLNHLPPERASNESHAAAAAASGIHTLSWRQRASHRNNIGLFIRWGAWGEGQSDRRKGAVCDAGNRSVRAAAAAAAALQLNSCCKPRRRRRHQPLSCSNYATTTGRLGKGQGGSWRR